MIGRGIDTSNSREISDAYLKYGCVVNISGSTSVSAPEELNQHPDCCNNLERYLRVLTNFEKEAQVTKACLMHRPVTLLAFVHLLMCLQCTVNVITLLII